MWVSLLAPTMPAATSFNARQATTRAAMRYAVNPLHALAVWGVEASQRTFIRNDWRDAAGRWHHRRDRGPFQIQRRTAKAMGCSNGFDSIFTEAADCAARILQHAQLQCGDFKHTVRFYNAWECHWPGQSNRYVQTALWWLHREQRLAAQRAAIADALTNRLRILLD
jgi:hypothetical protein